MGGRLTKDMWRKNHQWIGLTRKHTRLTVADQEVASVSFKFVFGHSRMTTSSTTNAAGRFSDSSASQQAMSILNLHLCRRLTPSLQAFAKHCFSGKDPDFGGWWRTCKLLFYPFQN